MDLTGSIVGLIVAALGLLLTAGAINRWAPNKRPRVRRILVLVVLYAMALGAATTLGHLGSDWSPRALAVAELLAVFTFINLGAVAVFDLILPLLRFELTTIVSDLTVGAGYLVGIVLVLHGRGMNFSDVLTTGAVVSGVLALSLQSTLGNVIGGVALQLDGSIQVGEWIALENGKQGRVKQIRWRHTVLETRDWATIVVPNSQLLGSHITILGKRDGHGVPHRMWVWFNVDFRHAPTRVIEVVTQALRSSPIERVAADPAPNCVCMDFAKDGSYASYAVRYWLTDLAADDPTNSAVRARVHAALRRADIPLARPVTKTFLELEVRDTAEQREAKHRSQRLKLIETIQLFRPLNPAEREQIADHVELLPFAAGETITRQGAVAHWLYILARGTVEIRANLEGGGSKQVATLSAPDFFGEMGLMTGAPRTADVIALTDCECFRLGREGFEDVILKRPELVEELSQRLAERRVELLAVREGLDAEAQRARQASEEQRILSAIKTFFGL